MQHRTETQVAKVCEIMRRTCIGPKENRKLSFPSRPANFPFFPKKAVRQGFHRSAIASTGFVWVTGLAFSTCRGPRWLWPKFSCLFGTSCVFLLKQTSTPKKHLRLSSQAEFCLLLGVFVRKAFINRFLGISHDQLGLFFRPMTLSGTFKPCLEEVLCSLLRKTGKPPYMQDHLKTLKPLNKNIKPVKNTQNKTINTTKNH